MTIPAGALPMINGAVKIAVDRNELLLMRNAKIPWSVLTYIRCVPPDELQLVNPTAMSSTLRPVVMALRRFIDSWWSRQNDGALCTFPNRITIPAEYRIFLRRSPNCDAMM